MNCKECNNPLTTNSKTQIVFWHKECRTKGRQHERKASKRNMSKK